MNSRPIAGLAGAAAEGEGDAEGHRTPEDPRAEAVHQALPVPQARRIHRLSQEQMRWPILPGVPGVAALRELMHPMPPARRVAEVAARHREWEAPDRIHKHKPPRRSVIFFSPSATRPPRSSLSSPFDS